MNILWDFDGTLFNTYPAYTEVFYKVLGGKVTREEIYEQLKVSYGHAIEFYKVSMGQKEALERLKKELQPKDMKPFEGVEEVLKFADKNVIMTHKHRKGVLEILKYYGYEKYFVDMVTGEDGFPRKPDPTSYDYLHQKYGIDLAIGDRKLDLLPAKALGITTCMFQNNDEVADYCMNEYSEFFQLDLVKEKK